MAKIIISLAYLNGDVTQVNNSDRFQLMAREPRNFKNKETGKWETRGYIKYKIFVSKHKIPQSILDYASFKDRKDSNISLSLSFCGSVDQVYTREDNPKVIEPQIIVSISSSDDFLAINKEMTSANSQSEKKLPDEYDF
jgi:hypothetical protein